MTATGGQWVEACVFERHPAAIERHGAPAPAPAPGFDGITTWAPHLLDAGGGDLATESQPAPAARPAPPPGYRPPPVPVRPAETPAHPHQEPVTLEPGAPEPGAPEPGAPEPGAPEPGALEPVALEPLTLEPRTLEHGAAVSDPVPLPTLYDNPAEPPLAVEAPVASSLLPARDPFAILKTDPQTDPPRGPARDAAMVWPGSSPFRRGSLPDDRAASLWDDEAVPDAPRGRVWPPRPRVAKAAALAFAGAACLAGLILAGLRYGPALFGSGQTVTAVFNAPMMVVRSAATGRVLTVAATATQLVDPKSPLLTIHTDDGGQDRSVLAGVHGMIRSVETVPGAALVAGAPLVRLQDCDRAFLTIPPGTKLQAGQTVQVKLPDQKPFTGTVRVSAGVMEPPDSLVVGLDPGAVTASCPVGRSATVTPLAS